LYLSLDLDYLSQAEFDPLSDRVLVLSRQLSAFITYLHNNPKPKVERTAIKRPIARAD
jgi:hypothetical protein